MGGSRTLIRGALIAVGALAVAASAYAVFALVPSTLGPEAGAGQAVTERVAYWTPEDGQQQALRPRTDLIQEDEQGLELVRELEGPHSPRGDRFHVDLGERWRLADEPAAHAAFPPTSIWEEPPEVVYVGVPWQTQRGEAIGGYDDFHRLGEVQRDGLTLVEYQAREPSQFLVDGDVVWFRAAERTAFVEPLSGIVVDYEDSETLWKAPLDRPDILHEIQPPRENREKVWEATVEPTPAGQQQLAEQAQAARADRIEQGLAYALPALLLGQGSLGAGLAGRPKRWLGAQS